MNLRAVLLVLIIALQLMLPACYLRDFEKEFEVEIIFDSNAGRGSINVSQLIDINDHSTDFRNNREYIEDIEIGSMSCRLVQYDGIPDRMLSGGILEIADQSGKGSEILSFLPVLTMEQLHLSDHELELNEPGRQRTEELILTDPNLCLGTFSGEVDEVPAYFIISFRIKGIIRGSLF